MLCSSSTTINSKSTPKSLFSSNMASTNLTIAILAIFVTLSLQGGNNNVVEAQLTTTFYSTSCPNLISTVRSTLKSAVDSQPRTGASILRLFFHDCFVNVSFCLYIFLYIVLACQEH